MDQEPPWEWDGVHPFPRFLVCLYCQLYWCSRWPKWREAAYEHVARGCKRPIAVSRGYPPPPNFRPGLGALEQLAALGRESGW